KVVVDAESVPAAVAEILADGAARIRCDVLHGSRVGSGSGHDDAVLHRAVLFQRFHDLGHRGPLLPDSDVNADDVAAPLVQDGVERDSSLARLPVADDQLALAAADGNHTVDGLETGLQRLFHRLPIDDHRRYTLESLKCIGRKRDFAIDRLTEGVHYPPDHRLSDWNRHDAAGAFHLVAFLDRLVLAQKHGADLVLFQVERNAKNIIPEINQLTGHHVFEPVNPGDAVADADDRSGLGHIHGRIVVFDFGSEYTRDFVCSDLSHNFPLA